MRVAVLAIPLMGCSGLNLDEDFVAVHGAAMAAVECRDDINAAEVHYQATMFWDGSVLASAQASVNNLGGATKFHERGAPDRDKGAVALRPVSSACSFDGLMQMESGDLNLYLCSSGSLVLEGSLDVGTDCSGFNKSLFD